MQTFNVNAKEAIYGHNVGVIFHANTGTMLVSINDITQANIATIFYATIGFIRVKYKKPNVNSNIEPKFFNDLPIFPVYCLATRTILKID